MIMKFKGFKANLRQQKNIILFKMPTKNNIKWKYQNEMQALASKLSI